MQRKTRLPKHSLMIIITAFLTKNVNFYFFESFAKIMVIEPKQRHDIQQNNTRKKNLLSMTLHSAAARITVE
jgi:hypothetical protein